MNFLVTKKVRSSAESFLTLTALIGSIWAVMFLVLNQSRPLTKDFSISAALERPCSGVSFSVLSKLGALAKEFSTFSALVWSFRNTIQEAVIKTVPKKKKWKKGKMVV